MASGTPSRPRIGRGWRAAIAVAVVVLVAALFTRTLTDNLDALADIEFAPGWWIAGAIGAFVIAVGVSGWLWGLMLGRLEPPAPGTAEAVRVHAGAWLMKYIPGQVGTVLYKLSWATDRGRSRLSTLVSVVYENAFLLIGSIVPMLGILLVYGLGSTELGAPVWAALAFTVPLAVLLQPAVFHRVVNALGARRLGRPVPPEMFLPTGAVAAFQAGYLLPRVVNGIGVGVIATAMVGASPADWIPIGAAYAVAGAVGILAVFVPSGLGVREGVFALLAAPVLGAEAAIVVSLVARVLATAADGALALVYAALSAARARKDA